jgi:hypothetical protein
MPDTTMTSDSNSIAAAALHKTAVNYAYLRLRDHLAVEYGFTEHGAHYTNDPETLVRLISETHRIADEMVSDTGNLTSAITTGSAPSQKAKSNK